MKFLEEPEDKIDEAIFFIEAVLGKENKVVPYLIKAKEELEKLRS